MWGLGLSWDLEGCGNTWLICERVEERDEVSGAIWEGLCHMVYLCLCMAPREKFNGLCACCVLFEPSGSMYGCRIKAELTLQGTAKIRLHGGSSLQCIAVHKTSLFPFTQLHKPQTVTMVIN